MPLLRQRLRFVGSQLFKFPQLVTLSSFCSYSPTIVTVDDLTRAIDKLGFKTTGNRIGIALPSNYTSSDSELVGPIDTTLADSCVDTVV